MSISEMSVSGAVMILAVVVIRAMSINRLPKKTFLVLWDITLVRLLVPYSLPSAFSVYSLAGVLVPQARTGPLGTGIAAIQPAGPPIPDSGALPPAPDVSSGISAIEPYTLAWLSGMLACAVFFAAVYLKCRREFREALPVDNSFALDWLKAHPLRRTIRLRQSDRISAPLTYGVFRPVILLSKRTDWGDEATLAYVLTHEYVHIRRFDGLTKLALAAVLCVHWFNPAVWVMYVLANRDLELSCDEAVIRLHGEQKKSAYAMALIRMEETRSSLRPLCNNFSKHAMEERIVAIMKMKKTTWLAAVTALALIIGITTAFATSARDNGQNREGPDRKLDSQVETVYNDSILMSYTDPKDGKTYYSRDNGKSWELLTEKELEAMDPTSHMEWWTAEGYAAWLEQEKIDLQSIIGSQGWTPSTGWFTWTQEMVDEAIARYEQTLKDIRAGQKISKPTADGDVMIMSGFDPDSQTSVTDTQVAVGCAEKLESISDDDVAVGYKQQLTPELLAEYKTYGLTYDEAKREFFLNGKLVRWLFDGYDIGNGIATIYDYVNEDGIVDVRTVRQATQNADGSTDPGGKLTGIEEVSQSEFDSRFIRTPQTAQDATSFGFVGDAGGITFEERFSMYKSFGITYVEADGVSGRGNVYLNGKLVSHFTDVAPNGSAFSFTSAEQGGINVRTVYDGSGNLAGVEAVVN